MPRLSEAHKLFMNEVRDKKRTASGVHHKTGKNGYVGKMRFPSDLMSRSEKMKHRKAGKVVTTFLYEEIIPIEEFEKLEKNEQKNMLAYWRNVYTNKEITQKMGIWNNKYYKLVAELDLPRSPRVDERKPRRKAKVKEQASNISPPVEPVEPEKAIEAPEKKEPVQEVIVDGMHLIFNGTYSPELIIKQLSKFELLLDGEEDDFYIELKLVQKSKAK